MVIIEGCSALELCQDMVWLQQASCVIRDFAECKPDAPSCAATYHLWQVMRDNAFCISQALQTGLSKFGTCKQACRLLLVSYMAVQYAV